ncbi:MAG: HDOD domain-containing protein [Brevinematia bacterium]
MDEEQLVKWNRIIENTTPLPFIVGILLKKLEDPEVSIKEIENLLEKDPLLVAKVLKMSNSAYYGFPRMISTVKEAIVVLGLNTIRSIVLAISIRSVMRVDSSGYLFSSVGGLWEHSMLAAGGARIIARKLKLHDPEKYFVAGLLHDIGKIVLSSFAKEYKIEFLKNFLLHNKSISQSEEEMFGVSHNVIGHLLANYWNLPQFISDVVLYHDDPFSAPNDVVSDVLVVSSANELSYNFVSENLKEMGVADKRNVIAMKYLEHLGIPNERDNILNDMKKVLDVSLEV